MHRMLSNADSTTACRNMAKQIYKLKRHIPKVGPPGLFIVLLSDGIDSPVTLSRGERSSNQDRSHDSVAWTHPLHTASRSQHGWTGPVLLVDLWLHNYIHMHA